MGSGPNLQIKNWHRLIHFNLPTWQECFANLKYGDLVGEKAYQAIKNAPLSCSWCHNRHASIRMKDGLIVCKACVSSIYIYYHCQICKKELKASEARFFRKRYEAALCRKKLCRKQYDVQRGRICCEKAVYVPCVCSYAYRCSIHAPNTVHVGSHD